MPSRDPNAAAKLRAALRAPDVCLATDDVGRAGYLLRSHILEGLGEAVAQSGVRALLVKGAALAVTVYAKPWQRTMSDIDVLVRPREQAQLIEALEAAGCRRTPRPSGRIWSDRAFGETPLVWQEGSVSQLVEVHHALDKLVSRPLDYDGIFRRSFHQAGVRGFLVPNAVDHALLVVLHAAASEFDHPIALVDLELLFRSGLDVDVLARRARAWKLETALFVCLSTLRLLGAPSVPERLLAQIEPTPLRRRTIKRFYDINAYPVRRRNHGLGVPWILKQTPLRDDLAGWLTGVGRYGAQRAVERSLGAFAPGRALARRLGAVYAPTRDDDDG